MKTLQFKYELLKWWELSSTALGNPSFKRVVLQHKISGEITPTSEHTLSLFPETFFHHCHFANCYSPIIDKITYSSNLVNFHSTRAYGVYSDSRIMVWETAGPLQIRELDFVDLGNSSFILVDMKQKENRQHWTYSTLSSP